MWNGILTPPFPKGILQNHQLPHQSNVEWHWWSNQ